MFGRAPGPNASGVGLSAVVLAALRATCSYPSRETYIGVMKKPLLWAFVIAAVIMGCDESPSPNGEQSGDSKNAQLPLRYVMLNKEQCDLKGDARETTTEDITGIWVDSLLWKNRRPDTCWYGVKSLDRHIRLELKKSKVFIWTEKYADATHDRTDKGEFFLSNDSSSTTLMIARNKSIDTLFAQGDTMNGKEFKLYWTGEKRLLLVPSRTGVEDDDYEVYEMVRGLLH